ncbi:hypothetical protein L3X38_042303 [Prunus dulcis]|uniref:Uncharacterized protein n=1 Tax=Prunus dulcis TaxID=3755 RepID=A0AAD4UW16_PRUDU|nr:hypothetical protein L3X38_042303 [Prunus dulcis]
MRGSSISNLTRTLAKCPTQFSPSTWSTSRIDPMRPPIFFTAPPVIFKGGISCGCTQNTFVVSLTNRTSHPGHTSMSRLTHRERSKVPCPRPEPYHVDLRSVPGIASQPPPLLTLRMSSSTSGRKTPANPSLGTTFPFKTFATRVKWCPTRQFPTSSSSMRTPCHSLSDRHRLAPNCSSSSSILL